MGYGNIGKHVLEALEAAPDFEVAGIVRRQAGGEQPAELAAYPVVSDIRQLEGVDVAILATPTRKVEEYAKDILALGIHTVDSFDIHTQIPALHRTLGEVARQHGTVAVISAGWDPGSDSIVRALLTGRMFLWHIYPQEENAHLVKLEAFMERMRHELRSREEQDAFEDYRALMLAYNGEGSFPASALDSLGPVMTAVTARFARRLLDRGTLASSIRAFVREKCGFQLNSRA